MFTCVKDHRPAADIRIPAWAAEHEAFAAAELAGYVRRSTGAELPVIRGLRHVPKGAIVLADLSHPATPRLLPADLGEGLRHDGYRMRVIRGRLYIVSHEPGGLVFAVYEYLRRFVGCRFLDYGETGEHVPQQVSIRHADPDILDNPQLWYRGLQTYCESHQTLGPRVDWMAKNGFSHLLVVPEHRYEEVTWQECRRWLLPEMQKRGLKLAFGHHLFKKLLPPEQYLSERPDFFGLVDPEMIRMPSKYYDQLGRKERILSERTGKRMAAGQLNWCLSNDEMVATVARRVVEMIREHPQADLVNLWPDDGLTPACGCQDCARLDDPRDFEATDWAHLFNKGFCRGNRGKMRRYLHLANQVAQQVAQVYPKVRLSILSYVDITEPPVDARLHPNLVVCLALYMRCSRHHLHDPRCPINRQFVACIDEWLKVLPAQSLILYEYYMGMNAWRSLPWPILTNLFAEWEPLASRGLGGAHVQSRTQHLAVYGINYLAFARLGREERPSLDAFLDDYCRDFFGAGAEPVAKVFRLWEKNMHRGPCRRPKPELVVKRLFPAASIKACRRWVGEALALTADPIHRRRIERVGAMVEYVELWRQMPEDYAQVRKGQRVRPSRRDASAAWVRSLETFVERHVALNDGIFPGNVAAELRLPEKQKE